MSFTLIFGMYSALILSRTKNILACISLHSQCNFFGFPKIFLISDRPRSEKNSIQLFLLLSNLKKNRNYCCLFNRNHIIF